jgi:hypothetical protein
MSRKAASLNWQDARMGTCVCDTLARIRVRLDAVSLTHHWHNTRTSLLNGNVYNARKQGFPKSPQYRYLSLGYEDAFCISLLGRLD